PAFRSPAFAADSGAPEHRAVLQHDFAVQVRDRFLLGWRYAVDTNIRNDPTRRTILGIRGTEAAFEVLDAYATVRGGPFRATVGRAALSLGPGRAASPFVSESIPALDQIRLEVGNDPVRFTALVATLSRERPNRLLDESGNTIPGSFPSDSAPVPFDVTRFLYLHRVDWRVVDHLQLAISEAAVVTGVDRGLELRFANPLIPFYLTQQEDDEADASNVNVVVNLEGVYTGLGKSRLYGDLFVQEFFIDADKREEIGNQLAWRLGAEWADPAGWSAGSLGAEYTRADVFTYLHRGLNTNWTTFGVPIGSMIGPDADQLLAWVDWWPAPTAVATVDLLLRRGGERSVATLESAIDAGNPAFPSGVVQRERRIGAQIHAFIPDYGVEGRFRIGHRQVANIANEADRDRGFWEAAIDLTYRLRLQ
ncbi:MAG TPA: capsule assembly Wzi family protein, partial [Gemmatimonadota bacterium]|nr:capsule assembly Wzi family protein [Gemmatimonadota bacterium]